VINTPANLTFAEGGLTIVVNSPTSFTVYPYVPGQELIIPSL
jgi:hypothetical protein